MNIYQDYSITSLRFIANPPVSSILVDVINFLSDDYFEHTKMQQETAGVLTCQGRARFQQHRDASCHQFLFSSQGDEGNSRHSDRNISLSPSWSG